MAVLLEQDELKQASLRRFYRLRDTLKCLYPKMEHHYDSNDYTWVMVSCGCCKDRMYCNRLLRHLDIELNPERRQL